MPSKAEIARANGMKGGRPKGAKSKSTLVKEVVKKDFDERVLRLNDRLINAQASLALGQTFLYKIEKEWIKTGEKKNGEENGYFRNLKPKLVTAQWEIESYLERLAENNGTLDDENDPEATYYFLTTKEPDNKAIDSLRDRTFGKAKEHIEVTGEIKFSLKGLAQRRAEVDAGTSPNLLPAVEAEIKDASFTVKGEEKKDEPSMP